jgi:cell division transport system permease protein
MTPLNNAWHHIRRSPIQSFVAVLVMTTTFFCLTTFIVVSSGLSSILSYFETKPEVTIFLQDGLDRNTVESLQKELANYPSIREVKFISKEKALAIYKEQNNDNPMLTEMVTASILPASFEVSVSDPKVLEQIAKNFSAKKDQVEEIIYQKDVIDSLITWTSFIRQAGIILVSVSATLSFFIVAVIIGMKITNRKDEIRISRLLGASKFYVKKPFLLEGLFYGFWGGAIGSLTTLALSFYFNQPVNQFFSPVIFISQDTTFYFYLITGSIVLGSLVGYFASFVGSRRYIKF